MRSLWALLLVSSAIELVTVFRPSIPCANLATGLFADLALQTLLLLGLPAAWIGLSRRGRFADAGLTLATWRNWLRWLVPLAAIALPLALLGTRIPSIHAAYPRLWLARSQPWLLIPSTLAFAGFGLAWEFFFRGFLMLGLKPRLRQWAIVVQALPCALMHVGKPDIEVAAAFPAALVLGVLAYRTGSVIPGWLLHLAVALVINLGCVFWPLS